MKDPWFTITFASAQAKLAELVFVHAHNSPQPRPKPHSNSCQIMENHAPHMYTVFSTS